jgi:hypothetical protein
MKHIFLILTLLSALSTYGQSDSIEKAVIYQKVLSKAVSQEEYVKLARKWNETLKKAGRYPDLPLDQDGRVYYSFEDSFDHMNKQKLFNRGLEWLSIKHGILPSGLYSNLEDGKIIYRSNFNIANNITGNYTSVITIQDNKLLTEFINISYETFYAGHYSGDTWVPERYINSSIEQVYPIVLKNPSEWNLNLEMLKTTNDWFRNEIANLHNYIIDYEQHYVF